MNKDLNITLAKRNLIDSIWKEANIEGIAVTFPETKEIFEGRVVNNLTVDETVAINNLKHVWQFILDTLDYPIDVRILKQINKEIGAGIIVDAGNLRNSVVSIGGTAWKPDLPDYDVIKSELAKIQNEYKGVKCALKLFTYLCRTQPFLDGNKRTSQLIANKYMIENGLGVFSIPVEKKLDFETKLINFYETNLDTDLITMLKNTSICTLEKCSSEEEQTEEYDDRNKVAASIPNEDKTDAPVHAAEKSDVEI